MKKGDIVLITFPFTDLSGNKNRPALILVDTPSHVIVAFISTQTKWKNESDIFLSPNEENRLKKDSIIRLDKLASIDKDLILGKLGKIRFQELQEIDKKLIQLFNISSDF